ncbi:hypothetical protein FRC14_007998 [Serendipita sp. 396]|nr:hypothetical protein FRC14_007998 [Serendipita sp. 396]KAG8784385.1 hypothetical protein FRC15_003338 [Serendipita sp. 397]KAG8793382.1 hypothetical protein FRC16_010993 [Serendipita sp. 398]KAG8817406.1 hypothetical protein FRC19_011363 [Serendipita sp. 401]KAG8838254.1 hypothetical protein FRC18_005458 [Serendipita sp. 400]KAG8847189.1 hypothetical protein FRB91_012031 [Serendipita sp. 411]KAG8862056.1 hypothetical protein FRC20_011369 [Serendipita sp. 405]KAG9054798.1 hypothetical prot
MMHQHRNYTPRSYGSLDSMVPYANQTYNQSATGISSTAATNGVNPAGYQVVGQHVHVQQDSASMNMVEGQHSQYSAPQQVQGHNNAVNTYAQHANYSQHAQQMLNHHQQQQMGVYRTPTTQETVAANWHQQQHPTMRYHPQTTPQQQIQMHQTYPHHAVHPQHPHSQHQYSPHLVLRPLDAYLLARALQNAPPHHEKQYIFHFAQNSRKDPNILLQAYEQRRREIDELVTQLRAEDAQSQTLNSGSSYVASPMSTTSGLSAGGMHGAYTSSGIPPTVISLQPAGSGHQSSLPPTSAPPSYSRTMTTTTLSSELDLPSEASSPMLETPTSAVIPAGGTAVAPSGKLVPTLPPTVKYPTNQLNGGYSVPNIIPQHPLNESDAIETKSSAVEQAEAADTQNQTLLTSADLPTATKPGSRDGEQYTELEIRLIEQVIREEVARQPDIKLAQLGGLIHNRDQARPATAWARQLSKRKQAIDRARELVKNGKDISRLIIDVNRKDKTSEADTDEGEGDDPSSPLRAPGTRTRVRGTKETLDDDEEYDDRPPKRRRGP